VKYQRKQFKIPKEWIPVERRIAENILDALMIGVMIMAFLSSPFGLYIVAKGATKLAFKKAGFNREIKRLKRQGYIALEKKPNGWLIRLTKKGKAKANQLEIKKLRLPRNKRWDGKWRFLIFDIPEKERLRRDYLRKKLKAMGMYNIQRSTFVYPYDCEKELGMVTGYYRVEKYTTYVEANSCDIDRQLRAHFKV